MSAEIGLFQGSVEMKTHSSSAWARSYKISVQSTNGDTGFYFLKVNIFSNNHGLRNPALDCHI